MANHHNYTLLSDLIKREQAHSGQHQPVHFPKRIFGMTLSTLSPKKHHHRPPTPHHAPSPTVPLPTSPFPTLDPVRTAVELSEYPRILTPADVWALFSDFYIGEFALPKPTNFYCPMRVRIEVSGEGEAERAVRDLDGKVLGGRKIKVKMVENMYNEKEDVMEGLASEMKVNIINATRLLVPQHANKILEVRELMTATIYYAFLQSRATLTKDSTPEAIAKQQLNEAAWELIATGQANPKHAEGRLKALEDLQRIVEKQGNASQEWSQWEGSKILNYDYCEFDFGGT